MKLFPVVKTLLLLTAVVAMSVTAHAKNHTTGGWDPTVLANVMPASHAAGW